MQDKLMISINHEERRSICKAIFPNTGLLNAGISMLLPVIPFTAGIDVTIATSKTKRKLILALRVECESRTKTIPTIGSKRAKENKTVPVI